MTRKSKNNDNSINVSKIEKLAELMKKNKLDVIQAESEFEKICLARNVGNLNFFQTRSMSTPFQHDGQHSSVATTHNPSNVQPIVAEPTVQKTPDGHQVISPFVGTFYRAPSPDSPPFVNVGSVVKKGQSLCIVEAMKLMNEIEADIDGKITAILLENGNPVEFGTPLFVIEPHQ